MKNELFVDNPLTLTGLFGQGIYVIPENIESNFNYVGAGVQKILNIVYYDGVKIQENALEAMHKIMNALGFSSDDFAMINVAEIMAEDRLTVVLDDFEPIRVIIWSDQWFSPQPEVLFYQENAIKASKILRCHSLETVIVDEDRKKECWTSIKAFFWKQIRFLQLCNNSTV